MWHVDPRGWFKPSTKIEEMDVDPLNPLKKGNIYEIGGWTVKLRNITIKLFIADGGWVGEHISILSVEFIVDISN